MSNHHFRLGICNFPPFTYLDHGSAYGPWLSLIRDALPRNATSAIVMYGGAACSSKGMLQSIAAGEIDVAVHPMVMDGACDGCMWSYPLASNGLVMVSGLESQDADIFLSAFTFRAWLVMAAVMAAFVLSTVVMEWRRSRWSNAPHTVLTLAANLHMAPDVMASTYTLYAAMVVCSTLMISLYTADMTSTVLQEKTLVGSNVKAVIASGKPFSAVVGGPVLQMGMEYPNAAFTTVTAEAAETSLPCLMLWEQGERLVNKMCDPVVSVSGAMNRIPYSMALSPAHPGIEQVNFRLKEASLADTIQRDMVSWIPQRYTCVENAAVQVDRSMMRPLLLATLVVYGAAVIASCVGSLIRRRRAAREQIEIADL